MFSSIFEQEGKLNPSSFLRGINWKKKNIVKVGLFLFIYLFFLILITTNLVWSNSGMLRHESPPNLHNLAKWHLKRVVLIRSS